MPQSEIKQVWRAIHSLTIEVKKLSKGQKQLFEGQRRLFEGQRQLFEGQRRLFEAQRRTEETLRNLAIQVGRLSDAIGYGLEDIARIVLPGYLLKHYNIEINSLERKFIEIDGRFYEINLYGVGLRKGKKVIIAGECKSRIYQQEIKRFDNMIKKMNLKNEVVKIVFGYFIDPLASREAQRRNIIVVTSYQKY